IFRHRSIHQSEPGLPIEIVPDRYKDRYKALPNFLHDRLESRDFQSAFSQKLNPSSAGITLGVLQDWPKKRCANETAMRLVLAITLCLPLLSPPASACSCSWNGGCPGLGNDKGPVFLGTVLEVADLPRTADFVFLASRKARIRVDESFGGL